MSTSTLPAVGTQGETALSSLAEQIVEKHQAATVALAACVEHAMGAGDLLIQAKAEVGHGQFGEWVERNCKMSYRTARVYMQLAGRRDIIETATSARSGLSLQEAIRIASGASGSILADTAKADSMLAGSAKISPERPERPGTGIEILEVWDRTPLEERRKFFDALGASAISDGVPDAWVENIVARLHKRLEPMRPAAAPAGTIPDDLSIPACLRRVSETVH